MSKMKAGKQELYVVLGGLAVGLVVCLVLAALWAALVSSGTMPVQTIPAASAVICALGAALGGYAAARKAGSKTLIYAAAVAGIMALVLLLCGLAFFEGPLNNWLRVLVATLAGAILAAVLAGQGRGSGRKSAYRRRR